jgi:hypothetical protein
MKHFLLLIFSLPVLLFAQSDLDVVFDPDVTEFNLEMDLSDEFYTEDNYGSLYNLSTDVKNVRLTFELVDSPAEWIILLCDDANCFSGQSGGNFAAPEPLVIDVDDYSLWKMSVRPFQTEGCGKIVFNFYDDSDTNTITHSEEFDICVTGIVSTKDFDNKVSNLNVYPNPVRSTINISDDSIVDEVVIYNLLGKPVKRFNTMMNNSLDLSELRDGVYLVGMYNEEQGLLKTSRILKKNSRP